MEQQALFGFDFMFDVMPFFVMAIFILVFIVIIITVIKSLTQWNQNNRSPVLTVNAKVVTKRADVRQTMHNQANNTSMNYTSSHTSYYITFEVESGDRMELPVSASEYSMLVEEDAGKLTFQGTRYLNFDRVR